MKKINKLQGTGKNIFLYEKALKGLQKIKKK